MHMAPRLCRLGRSSLAPLAAADQADALRTTMGQQNNNEEQRGYRGGVERGAMVAVNGRGREAGCSAPSGDLHSVQWLSQGVPPCTPKSVINSATENRLSH